MNLLYNPLPEAVWIQGVAYPVYTDFRNWIAFFDMIADETYRPSEKLLTSLKWYREKPPSDLLSAWNGLLQFADCEENPSGAAPEKQDGNSRPYFSWSYDSAYVLGAFRQCYQMDLRTIPFLHWYEFMALFEALPGDTPVKKRIGYRSINTSSIKDKTRRKEIEKIQRQIAIPHAPMSATDVGAIF
jgi:hypothetical protein